MILPIFSDLKIWSISLYQYLKSKDVPPKIVSCMWECANNSSVHAEINFLFSKEIVCLNVFLMLLLLPVRYAYKLLLTTVNLKTTSTRSSMSLLFGLFLHPNTLLPSYTNFLCMHSLLDISK